METSKLRKFASFARKSLIEQVGTKMKTVLAQGSLARRENPKAVAELEAKIADLGKQQTTETVAYTWFNRFCALRYMDVNRYTKIGILSPAEGQFLPEILGEAKAGHLDDEMVPKATREKVLRILDGTDPSNDPQGEAYRLLLVAACNHYHSLMPFMFEKIADFTELLLPDDLLSENSILTQTCTAITDEHANPKSKIESPQSVEVIGWLYQFYIADKKDDVFAALKKGKKITPQNIPAATQLFTPHWIVRYLVENSLGRLWMLNHPESKLVERMDYYIRPEEPETDYLKIASPEEIKICDPACGSGHMLTYAFDLLYAIYEEQGYNPTEIPRLILAHNLFGIEIDARAGALAAFALTMKAREKDRRFFSRPPIQNPKSQIQNQTIQNPNICVLENISIDPQEFDDYMDKVGRDLFSGGLQGVVNQWEEANNFGSLIRPLVTDVREVLELLRERQMGEDLFLQETHQKVLKALRQADFLSPKYHVAVTNPPYMGSRNMAKELKSFCHQKFPESKSDLFAVFIERSLELLRNQGFVGMITMQSWMFLSSYEDLRSALLSESTILTMAHLGERGFDSIGGAVVSTTAFVLTNQQYSGYNGEYFRLTDGESEAAKQNSLLTDELIRFRCSADDLQKINGQPIAYWVSDKVRDVFNRATPLEEIAEIRQGLATCNNDLFLRLWFEVSTRDTKFDAHGRDDAADSDAKWFPYTKGGGFRKWFGNNEYLVNWEDNGRAIHEYSGLPMDYKGAPVRAKRFYFQEGITYGLISTTGFTARRVYGGAVFDVGGSMIFPNMEIDRLQGFLCSALGTKFLTIINPTLNYQVGDVGKLPILVDQVAELDFDWHQAIQIFRDDWNASETSWEFEQSPLLVNENCDSTLAAACDGLRSNYGAAVSNAVRMERENNQVYISAYGLEDEVEPEPVLSNVTLDCNPHYRYGSDKSESELEALLLADTMREFVNYAVGCMLGRYSLDKPGLILANQGDTFQDYLRILSEHQDASGENPKSKIENPKFLPDDDNVIPMLDGDWFTDDITDRFKEFLKVTFGTEHYAENLTFLENALYPENATGKKRKNIRHYFLNGFYDHHIKLYKKRPIYWLFSSPKGTFNALIYMHRYRPDTVSTVLQYLRDFRDKLAHRRDHQQMVADSAGSTSAEKTKALKEVDAIKKQLKELEDYERDTLFPLAQKKLNIDLDDGVKHNYPLFGTALKKVTGLS
ncbi:MAG TPA: BREX-1 system adenine-specific DNA-methyltransferase PglX [Planctomycetaceae bacterium]|nr:BREX-1 system adenine-specific DNA-methyltransferase PglX [Planctomycetaceae bacterium]